MQCGGNGDERGALEMGRENAVQCAPNAPSAHAPPSTRSRTQRRRGRRETEWCVRPPPCARSTSLQQSPQQSPPATAVDGERVETLTGDGDERRREMAKGQRPATRMTVAAAAASLHCTAALLLVMRY